MEPQQIVEFVRFVDFLAIRDVRSLPALNSAWKEYPGDLAPIYRLILQQGYAVATQLWSYTEWYGFVQAPYHIAPSKAHMPYEVAHACGGRITAGFRALPPSVAYAACHFLQVPFLSPAKAWHIDPFGTAFWYEQHVPPCNPLLDFRAAEELEPGVCALCDCLLTGDSVTFPYAPHASLCAACAHRLPAYAKEIRTFYHAVFP